MLNSDMKNAIILFVRHPEKGKVKTRLAKEIGDDAALQVYQNLLQHTHSVTCNLGCDKFVFYTDEIIETDGWENEIYFKRSQRGNDLGERMLNAFIELFSLNYKKVIIIGSDCPGLSFSLIESAFKSLDSYNVVLGPAADGGYYLLGLTQLEEELFKNKTWSTDTVLKDTIGDLVNKKLSYSLLQVLQDLDTKEDLSNISQY